MHLFTVATSKGGYFDNFKESCVANGIHAIVLGYGQKWKGFTWRLNLLAMALETVPGEDIVIFTDAYDVICLKSMKEIKHRFLEFQSPIVLGKDGDSVINRYMYRVGFGPLCLDQPLNGGFYMGYASAIRALLALLIQCQKRQVGVLKSDDQYLFLTICQTHKRFFEQNVQIDIKNRLVYNSDIYLSVQCDLPAGKDPCFIHCPGNQPMQQLVQKYGYTPPGNAQVNESIWSRAKRLQYYLNLMLTRTFGCNWSVLIVLTVVVCILVKNKN